VTNVHAFENGFAGIFAQRDCRHIYVGHCQATNNPGDPAITRNHSGNGILFYGTAHSLIEFCEAAHNGWDQPKGPPNGPVGIWCATSHHIMIQYCISHHNRSTAGDGGGFDLDGGTQDSVIQFCYSYNNHSSGYLMWEYGSRTGIKRNTVRFCISENDREGGVRFGTSGPGGIEDIHIHNNVVVNDAYPAAVQHGGELSRIQFRNNIFITRSGIDCVHDHQAFTHQGNCYWRTDGSFAVGNHSSLDAWRQATGQEMHKEQPLGMHTDPLLTNPVPAQKPTDPRELRAFFAYRLQPGSPCLGAGLDLHSMFGTDAGEKNFFGESVGADGRFHIGLH
jgi:hypothetical protein